MPGVLRGPASSLHISRGREGSRVSAKCSLTRTIVPTPLTIDQLGLHHPFSDNAPSPALSWSATVHHSMNLLHVARPSPPFVTPLRVSFLYLCFVKEGLTLLPGYRNLRKKSIIHRDISMHNILLGLRNVTLGFRGVLIDFDMAHWLHGARSELLSSHLVVSMTSPMISWTHHL